MQSAWTIDFGSTGRSSRVRRDHLATLVPPRFKAPCAWYARLMRVLVIEEDPAIAGLVAKGSYRQHFEDRTSSRMTKRLCVAVAWTLGGVTFEIASTLKVTSRSSDAAPARTCL